MSERERIESDNRSISDMLSKESIRCLDIAGLDFVCNIEVV